MRGKLKSAKSLQISGNVYLKHEDDELINDPQIGDIYMYLNLESLKILYNEGVYYTKGRRGYFKAKIFDGINWCMLDCLDFFEYKENYFSINEICVYAYSICKEILENKAETYIYNTYRDHYSLYFSQPGVYI